MNKLVTIGVPVYKRLHYLPNILKVVASQDYPNLELLVSDNGMNGRSVQEIVNQCYPKPYKFRQNGSTLSMSTHFNQLVKEASGEYFVLLADDDEISSNYVSELAKLLERNPQASVAISKQEIMDESGVTIRRSKETLPDSLSGTDFIRAAWHTYEYRYESFATIFARTKDIRACGGYPDFTLGTHNDDALLIKLCLNKYVVVSQNCIFRYRMYDDSHGWSISIHALAESTNEFLRFLDFDPRIKQFASAHPAEWQKSKEILVKMGWKTYYNRWRGMYQKRLTYLQWVKSAFALPFIAAYYKAVASAFVENFVSAVLVRMKHTFPWAYDIYRAGRSGRS
jgi:glycosyltransferase involved in cell wall biosynthesis